MSLAQSILEALRNDQTRRTALAEIVVDQSLAVPTAHWVDADYLSQIAIAALTRVGEHPELQAQLEKQAQRFIDEGHLDFPGAIGDKVAMTVIHPIQELLDQRDYSPQRQLVHALMDHPTMQELLREMLISELSSFGAKIRGALSEQTQRLPGARIASRLAGVAKGVASVVSSELERQVEDRAREFVGGALQQSTQKLIDRICSPEFAPELARWRVGVLHALLALPGNIYQRELSQVNRQQAAQGCVELWQALAASTECQDAVHSAFSWWIEEFGARTGQELLEDLGLASTLRPALVRYAEQGIANTCQSPAFAAWLESLVQEVESQSAKV